MFVGTKNNIRAIDGQTRIVVGVVVGFIGLATLGGFLGFGTTIGLSLSLVGLILVGTRLVRVCLLYRLFGIDTSRT